MEKAFKETYNQLREQNVVKVLFYSDYVRPQIEVIPIFLPKREKLRL
jgi:hypothetical protein